MRRERGGRDLLPHRLARSELGPRRDPLARARPFPCLKDTYFGNITRIPFVRQHPEGGREAKAREIAAWMGKPLEIHDLGTTPLERLLAPLVEGMG